MGIMLDNDGRLHAKRVVISTAGVSPYLSKDILGYEKSGKRVLHLLRHPEELQAAADGLNGAPVLRHHAPVGEYRRDPTLVVGVVGSNCRYIHPYLVADHLVLWDRQAIDGVLNNTERGLSSGFHDCTADMTPGEFNGEPYDGVLRDLRGEHVALTQYPKAGADCRIRGSLRLSPEVFAMVA